MNTTPLAAAAPRASALFDQLAAGDWSAVAADFDPTMREALPPAKLAEVWAQVVGTVGALETSDAPVARRAADITVVDVGLHFEAGDMVGRVSVRDDQTIAGLFILDPQAAAGEAGGKSA